MLSIVLSLEHVLALTRPPILIKMPETKPEAGPSPNPKATGTDTKCATIQRKTEPTAKNTPVIKAVAPEVREDGRGQVSICELRVARVCVEHLR